MLAHPLLGALPHDTKKKLEAAVQSPLFTVVGSTGLNILLNGLFYPLLCMGFAAAIYGPAVFFSQEINIYIFVGLLLAAGEGLFRFREGIFHAKPADELIFFSS